MRPAAACRILHGVMRAPLRPLFVLACIVLPLLSVLPPAQADEWSDARKTFRKALRAEDIKARREAFIDLLMFDGTENTEEVRREINNIKDDFAKEIAKTYEKA